MLERKVFTKCMLLKKAFTNSIYTIQYNWIHGDKMSQKTRLERFDLLLPAAAIEVVQKEAAIRGISPRTMGRILLVEKTKELMGLAPDDVLPDVNPVQACHTTTPTEGEQHDRCNI